MSRSDALPRLFGRSSSHYTRLVRIFADELGVEHSFVPVGDLASRDPADFGGNPALKLPVFVLPDGTVFGAENICRTLAGLAAPRRSILWTEDLPDAHARNAQELTWHAMSAQVQWVFGMQVAGLPPENLYFAKGADGFRNALAWLDANLDTVLSRLPAHELSLLEASLFCLIEHLVFRATVPIAPYPALVALAQRFGMRASARRTAYVFDAVPAA